jgi:predicted secreted acid phosphatase
MQDSITQPQPGKVNHLLRSVEIKQLILDAHPDADCVVSVQTSGKFPKDFKVVLDLDGLDETTVDRFTFTLPLDVTDEDVLKAAADNRPEQ